MVKIFITIGVIYILYYASNIVYDLFLKKEKIDPNKVSIEEFSFKDISENQSVENIEIDDVENIKTPSSYNNSFPQNNFQSELKFSNSADDLLSMKNKYDEENEIDSFKEPLDFNSEVESIGRNNNQIKWEEILNLAETKVKMVSNFEGYKVYKTI